MAITFIQSVSTNGNSTGAATTAGITTTSGNLVVVTVGGNNTSSTYTVTDSKTNTWTPVRARINGLSNGGQMFWAKNLIGGSGHTFTITDSGGAGWSVVIVAQEFSGVDTTSPFDTSAGTNDNSGTSTALASGNTATTAQADELIVGGGLIGGSSSTFTLGSGFTNLAQNGVSGTVRAAQESQVVSATGTQNAAMSISSGAAWIMFTATFKAAPAKPSFQVNHLRPAIFKPGIAR